MESPKIKVLVVDDSRLVRETISDILSADPQIEVVGTASDPYEAVTSIQECVPDVITLDIEMPRMDGITFLKKLMRQHPIPVIILSAHTSGNKELAMKAFESGAFYVLNKPQVENRDYFLEYSSRICEVVKMAATQNQLQKRNLKRADSASAKEEDPHFEEYLLQIQRPPEIIAIGASAGGTIAIQTVLTEITRNPPPIVITQHMPAGFTKEFANRLDRLVKLKVSEAIHGEELLPGHVYIAPGDQHLSVNRVKGILRAQVDSGPLINHHRPAVDVLFNSVAQICGNSSVAFLLTGMGKDGAQGLLSIKEKGGITFAQDQYSSLVFGMPGEAMRLGAAINAIPLAQIGKLITRISNFGKKL